jgi:hypothetical protein
MKAKIQKGDIMKTLTIIRYVFVAGVMLACSGITCAGEPLDVSALVHMEEERIADVGIKLSRIFHVPVHGQSFIDNYHRTSAFMRG